jgi:hypothetical protein
MALLGQASGGWTESSSALRLLHVGIRNTVGVLSNDSFTQTNPPLNTGTTLISQSAGMDTSVLGVLSGSVAIARPDQGSNVIGGPGDATVQAALSGATATGLSGQTTQPLGLFINDAAGYSYENTPAAASGKGPYVSGQGTYASSLYETQIQGPNAAATNLAGDAITYVAGMELIASTNCYLMPRDNFGISGATGVAANDEAASLALMATVTTTNGADLTIGILKMPADAVQPEIVFDQRI